MEKLIEDGIYELDYETAVEFWRPLAQQGDPIAQFNLGMAYAQGRGVTQNDSEAAKWFRLAAEQGVADAQSRLWSHARRRVRCLSRLSRSGEVVSPSG